MAENKMGPNIQAGAGIFAKRVQKSLSRAQEKVLQKLGKTMETKDELFEQCSQNLNKQQTDGVRLYKDVKAYYSAVKVMHESSRRLSQTLKDIYESDWHGGEDLSVIMESEDLLWNDYEEKLTDQIVRTMENYTSQFPEVKERVAKRGRKLVDYDSARHHLEALQSAKKKDDAKITKADEEFNKAQHVFDEINKELREELPALYQSRIGCYVTVFQNVSNLRDVFYKEMSVLNHELYNVMKKLETQHSGKAFIIKGLSSTKSKARKSIVISNPIPCNTAFPADHVSLHASGQNGQDPGASAAPPRTPSTSEEPSPPEEGSAPEFPPSNSVTSDSDDLSSDAGDDTSKRQSACESVGSGDGSAASQNPEEEEEEAEQGNCQSDDSGVEVPRPDSVNQGVDREAQQEARPARPANPPQQEAKAGRAAEQPAPQQAKAKPPPVPAPRVSFHSSEKRSSPPTETDPVDQKGEAAPHDAETKDSETSESQNPPGFLYKAVALESHTLSEEGLLQFEEGDVILVLASQEEGVLKGIREESWEQHHDVEQHSGIFLEKLVRQVGAEGATEL